MHRIVCYGDSNTWGYVAGNGNRLPENQRWPSILQKMLGSNHEVIEAGVSGRTINLDDPDVDGRNGLKTLNEVLDGASPFTHLIIMLGTNDTKMVFQQTDESIQAAMRQLLEKALKYQTKFSFSTILVSPAPLDGQIEQSSLRHLFNNESRELSLSLADKFCSLAKELDIQFFDAGTVANPSQTDCVHLTVQSHKALADALYQLL